jgi:predicted nucleic acid-binding protein
VPATASRATPFTGGVRFVDTNVLLYAISRSPDERGKAAAAIAVLEAEDVTLSVQVLQEFYVQATRATRRDRISHDQAALLIESWMRFPVQEMTVPIVVAAMETARRFRISYWDAAIVEAARARGCDTVLSEDLGHGQDFGGVVVQDPFRPATRARPRRR